MLVAAEFCSTHSLVADDLHIKESRLGCTTVSWRLAQLQAGGECGDVVPGRFAFGHLLRSRSHRNRATNHAVAKAGSAASMQVGSGFGDMVPGRIAFGRILGNGDR